MRRTINNIVSVMFTLIKFCLMKILHWKNFQFYPIERFSPDVVTEFEIGSHIRFGKMIRVHSGSKIKVRKNGKLIIGDNVSLNYYNIIICHDEIRIGDGTELGPAVYIYDHDHDYSAGIKEGKFKSSHIDVGKNCWIGANTVILRGTKIGDNCVIGAGSVIKGEVPANSIVVQKRSTITKLSNN